MNARAAGSMGLPVATPTPRPQGHAFPKKKHAHNQGLKAIRPQLTLLSGISTKHSSRPRSSTLKFLLGLNYLHPAPTTTPPFPHMHPNTLTPAHPHTHNTHPHLQANALKL